MQVGAGARVLQALRQAPTPPSSAALSAAEMPTGGPPAAAPSVEAGLVSAAPAGEPVLAGDGVSGGAALLQQLRDSGGGSRGGSGHAEGREAAAVGPDRPPPRLYWPAAVAAASGPLAAPAPPVTSAAAASSGLMRQLRGSSTDLAVCPCSSPTSSAAECDSSEYFTHQHPGTMISNIARQFHRRRHLETFDDQNKFNNARNAERTPSDVVRLQDRRVLESVAGRPLRTAFRPERVSGPA